jgi:hypothetical protein
MVPVHDVRVERYLSTAAQVMIRPGEMFRAAVAADGRASWVAALETPALIAALLGVTTAIAAAQRLTASLFLSATLSWSFVPVLQLITGALLIRSAQNRRVTFPRALVLFFAGHGPWSVWLVLFAASQSLSPNLTLTIAGALVALGWTAVIVNAFAREVLGLSRRAAMARTIAHQLTTVALILIYIELATAIAVRIAGIFAL